MKFLASQLTYFLRDRQVRRNLSSLRRYLILLVGVILLHSILFHVIMQYAEGQSHSWLTGLYWTLVVMSTLGFGDITSTSDLGRFFSIVVLLSGIVLLLIMLPFAFIQYFYAPWIESRIRTRAPRSVPEDTSGHVIICRRDSICTGLIRQLQLNGIPYFVLEPDPVVAASMLAEDISVVAGELDNQATYEQVQAAKARLVFANAEDTTNTNIALTVREVSADVPICAVAEDQDSIDILELSGATYVIELKQRLGEHLAARISAGSGSAHVVGRFDEHRIIEFVVHETRLVGKTLREARLRELTGVNVVAVWERGRVQPLPADRPLSASSIPIAIGTQEQIARLNQLLGDKQAEDQPVLVIGAGKVGRATAAALELRGVRVHMVEKSEKLKTTLEGVVEKFVVGDAADRDVLLDAGLEDASAVALTTNDDAVNIYLTIYCRRLKPSINIVSRLTHERNTEAIYRAGADSVLSYSTLGREYVMSRLFGRDPVMVGEGADIFLADTPQSLVGRSLGTCGVGARTGLIVLAVRTDGGRITNPDADTVLEPGSRLLLLGTAEQRAALAAEFR